jgi:hypothetical protein
LDSDVDDNPDYQLVETIEHVNEVIVERSQSPDGRWILTFMNFLTTPESDRDERGAPVKTFFFMGRNPKNKSGVSWKINRAGSNVRVSWGPAVLKKRKVVPAGTLQTKVVRFSSAVMAATQETTRILAKLRKGYERKARRRLP